MTGADYRAEHGADRAVAGVPPNLRNLFPDRRAAAPRRSQATLARSARGRYSGWSWPGWCARAAAPWCARRVIRRRRWRRWAAARDGRQTARADRARARDVAWAHAAWQELSDDLMDYGAGSQPSESPRAVAARAGTGLSLADPARAALGRIAMAEERARYAPAPTDGSGLRADSAAVRRAIAAAVPRGDPLAGTAAALPPCSARCLARSRRPPTCTGGRLEEGTSAA